MSLLSSIILPSLERQLSSVSPEVAEFFVDQLSNIATEVAEWIEYRDKKNSVQNKPLGGES